MQTFLPQKRKNFSFFLKKIEKQENLLNVIVLLSPSFHVTVHFWTLHHQPTPLKFCSDAEHISCGARPIMGCAFG